MANLELVIAAMLPTFALLFTVARQDRIQLQQKVEDARADGHGQYYAQITWASDYASVAILSALGTLGCILWLGWFGYFGTEPHQFFAGALFAVLGFSALNVAFNEIHTTRLLRKEKRRLDKNLPSGKAELLLPPKY